MTDFSSPKTQAALADLASPFTLPYPGRPAATPPGTSAREMAGITGAVSPDSQALVWGIVASEHAAALMDLLTQQYEQREAGTIPATEDNMKLVRAIGYHRDSHTVADKVAGMWALINVRTGVEVDFEDDRCMPIGCDNGVHVPGCQYEARDDATGQDGEAG
jgi:hypothetical protein